MKKLFFLFTIAALAISLSGCVQQPSGTSPVSKISAEDAQVKISDFINKNLMQQGSSATIKSITEENGLYKVVVEIPDGQVKEVNSYLTLDGQIFFPQGINIKEFEDKLAQQDQPSSPESEPAVEAPKSDKPQVEVFVMSHCPYGTQIEKGLLPVMALLDNDEAEIDIKFVDYTMHGEKETIEQVVQYCIQKNEESIYDDYLKCFLASNGTADDSNSCVESTGVNKTQLQDCISNTNPGTGTEFNIYSAEAKKYGVQGSPTLVINGEQVQTGRSPQALLNAICSAFNVKPEDCNAKLDSATPAPGFGTGTASGSSAGGCGT